MPHVQFVSGVLLISAKQKIVEKAIFAAGLYFTKLAKFDPLKCESIIIAQQSVMSNHYIDNLSKDDSY